MKSAPVAVVSPARPLENSYWVVPGRLLAGEHPAAGAGPDLRARVQRMLEAGIDCFVDLTEEGEQADYRFLLPREVEYLRSPIADMGVPMSVAQTHALLRAIRAALARERRIYVHCRAGIGRTGLVIGCFLAEEAQSGRKALLQLNRAWQQSARAQSWPRVPQTAEQADYIRRWPKLRGLAE